MDRGSSANSSLRIICYDIFERQFADHASRFTDGEPAHRQLLDPSGFARATTPTPHEVASRVVDYAQRCLTGKQSQIYRDLDDAKEITSMAGEKQRCIDAAAVTTLRLAGTIETGSPQSVGVSNIRISDKSALKAVKERFGNFVHAGVLDGAPSRPSLDQSVSPATLNNA